jgi:hypothetical protein
MVLSKLWNHLSENNRESHSSLSENTGVLNFLKMTTPRSALLQTVSILRERGISVKQEDLQPVFEGPTTSQDATRWVEECLGEDTLLSKEEAALHVPSLINNTDILIENLQVLQAREQWHREERRDKP